MTVTIGIQPFLEGITAFCDLSRSGILSITRNRTRNQARAREAEQAANDQESIRQRLGLAIAIDIKACQYHRVINGRSRQVVTVLRT